MDRADPTAEEIRRRLAVLGQRAEVVLDLIRRPASVASRPPQQLQRVGVSGEFTSRYPAQERGAVAAVKEPLRLLPGRESRSSPVDRRENLQGHFFHQASSLCEMGIEPFRGAAVRDAPRTQPFPDLLDRADRARVDVSTRPRTTDTFHLRRDDRSRGDGVRVVGELGKPLSHNA